MPTSAKLVAAFWFGLIGFIAANAHLPALGEAAESGMNGFRFGSAGIGLVCGWVVMGKSVGGSYADSVGSGLKTSIVMTFFALLLFSGREMVNDAYKMRYDGPMDAMLGWFQKMMDNGYDALTVGVIGALVVGGAIGGPLSEWAWRRWR